MTRRRKLRWAKKAPEPRGTQRPPARWIVIPAHNEQDRLEITLRRYLDELEPNDRMVIVVNGSRDRTADIAHSAALRDRRVHVLMDNRRIGKGGAVMSGLRHVQALAGRADVVCYVDADGSVSPGELRRLCGSARAGGLIVGSRWLDPSRQERRQPLRRRVASRMFNRTVRFLFRLQLLDTQCGAKALTVGDLPALTNQVSLTGYAFDVDLILAARQAGLRIREFPLGWSDRPGSSVLIAKSALAVVSELLKLHRKYSRRGRQVALETAVASELLGTGPGVPPMPRRRPVLSRPQKAVALLLIAGMVLGVVVAPLDLVIALNAALTTSLAAGNILKMSLIRRAVTTPCVLKVDPYGDDWISDGDLPVYTVLLPVHREAAVLRQLLDGIALIDYPEHLLDVKLLVEIDDVEVHDALLRVDLPPFMEVLEVPDRGPRGKPRASNFGLEAARGQYLVIYDAEDRPEPDQLRKAVAAFRHAPPSVVCYQAKLNYFNRDQNLLTRWFTAEYSMWFDQLLPGLQAAEVAIPLGGTSNHFETRRLRDLGGWDAYNVTEDADLGTRLFLRGWKTAVLDSTTFEEANSRCGNWVRQRSRWTKGYIQTYLAYMRNPVRTARWMGLKAFLVFQLFLGAGTVSLLMNPIYWALTGLWFGAHVAVIQEIFPAPILYCGLAGFIVGNASFVFLCIAGCYSRHNYDDVKWSVTVPFYWLLMSVGAWKGLFQLFTRPQYWEKTVHGYSHVDTYPVVDTYPAVQPVAASVS